MIACIDSGNSRIKWGVHDGQTWLARGALDHADAARLGELPAAWPQVTRVRLANVAGAAAGERIRQALAAWRECLREAVASAAACGVSNGYRNPGQLGVDRWCALLAARALTPGAAVVVMAGTATTVDALDAAGHFRGGLILPGQQLMLRALARNTAGLPFAAGQAADFPTCTDDAIVSGALEAQAGAIERMVARLAPAAVSCLLSGGNAAALAARLQIPYRLVDDLPLEGLRRLAESGES